MLRIAEGLGNTSPRAFNAGSRSAPPLDENVKLLDASVLVFNYKYLMVNICCQQICTAVKYLKKSDLLEVADGSISSF